MVRGFTSIVVILIRLSPGPEPQLGGLYEPTVLPDYDPRLFNLKKAKLAQQEIIGTDGNLIGPWDTAAALRPGTLVAIEANLIIYSFCNEMDPGTVRLPPTASI